MPSEGTLDKTMGASGKTRTRSDASRAISEDGELKTHVGGQALIEGIMMRGKLNWAVAVREPDGNIYVEEHDLASGRNKNSWLRKPFIRGCTALVESLILGYKALEIAAEHAFDDEEEGEGATEKVEQSSGAEVGNFAAATAQSTLSIQDNVCFSEPSDGVSNVDDVNIANEPHRISKKNNNSKESNASEEKEGSLGGGAMTLSMIIGVVLGVVLFIAVPYFVTGLFLEPNTLPFNIVDGVLRLAVFIAYVWLTARMKDIKRMYMYHGAEHKTIHCFEHGLPLTPENARSFPRLHVRCGTAFLITVMIIAILVYSIIPINAILEGLGLDNAVLTYVVGIAIRIIFMPVIAGIAYEITVRWAGTHPNNPAVKVILWPGLQMQYLTTNEPDDSMLECAIAAMQCVLDRENAAEAAEKALDERAEKAFAT